ncbi:IclR family transcriptional regulator [Garciella nitratireducens]|uniref:Transcriptional regulator, IclR family n=1 Tax=Garciella nitratireducens DSM 15102 TaxID=1121911 RepID=A0A1T4L3U3_9FIRM|nr:IclR family transcriptional regulator [Garciella nitratireducens]RBP40623.1 IclR family transcriptional regulator [Garciella nitratireducens]SJZ49268.1 transcriptional regulator, IclR family [Garciella nitratireducens DSM 15102]
MKNQNNDIMRSLVRALNLLDLFMEYKTELSISEISEKMHLSTSTVYRFVTTLSNHEYLIKNQMNKKYFIGPKLIKLGMIGIKSMEVGIRDYARPFLDKIFTKYNETVSLYTLNEYSRVCIDVRESTNQLRDVVKIGGSVPLSDGGIGNLFLAYMDKENLKKILPDINKDLESKFKKIRKNQYLISQGERIVGIKAIALPIFDSHNKVNYAITLSGPKERFPEKQDLEKIQYLSKISQELSKILGNFIS